MVDMKFLFLTLCLLLSVQASSETFTSTNSSIVEEANKLLYDGIKTKDVDIVLEALGMGGQLESVAPEFGLSLYTVARRPEFYDAQIIQLIDSYLIGGSAALAQFRLNREIHREAEAKALLYAQVEDFVTYADHASASDAGSEAEFLHEHDFDAGSDADMPADDIFAHHGNISNPNYDYDAALSLTLSLSYSSPSGQ